MALAGLGILSAFLSFLFVASVGGRSDGREILFPVGVLNDPSCYLTGCLMVPTSTLNEVDAVAFNGTVVATGTITARRLPSSDALRKALKRAVIRLSKVRPKV